MNWQAQYAIHTYDLTQADCAIWAKVLAEGIEKGIEDLDFFDLFGQNCDACGEWRICAECECEESTPTDRGDEYRLLPYMLCTDCQRKMFTDV